MKKEKILIVGSGGREHALGYKLASATRELYFTPGNAGTAMIGTNIPIKEIQITQLAHWAKKNHISFTVAGSDAPLAKGIADVFMRYNLPIFAPSKKASRIESSKSYSSKFVEKYNIPHPQSYTFTNIKSAIRFIEKSNPKQWVIKADGLALGKGVSLPTTRKEALQAIEKMMIGKEFGESGSTIVIQERLVGQEVSILAFSDGKNIIPMLPVQDHKRIFDNDKGQNTGGMGTYAPVPFVTPRLLRQIQKTILQPTIKGMQKEGNPFVGTLFTGLMLTTKGPKVLEYNARFGDPETQSLMRLLASDLLKIMKACVQGKLKKSLIKFRKGSAVTIVIASYGYPMKADKGKEIKGLAKIKNTSVQIFHAATLGKSGKIVTNGGRVLNVSVFAPTLQKALKTAYQVIGKSGIYFEGMHYRRDIGYQAL